MAHKRENKGALWRRISRIERKCDLILCEIMSIKAKTQRQDSVDRAIERLHAAAKSLREESLREKRTIQERYL